ncbi:YveK family protein [Ammoniphilus sp. CFH 90114]|uniref:YveK family protein n=1 Tax=Ammoniphilus sp. CFH 90114 TaxID=2493665 RepID=UPI00100ECC44|nr:Wzz/FepE/Etk N-terminal domain-containing protein [Ammoniphilus sp. CFH 90114]RXT03685.1 capsular biosynthesis protein [Ammoniphilus sp. CFH 90114]
MEETTIDLREIVEIIKKRFVIIILVTLMATVTSGLVSFFVITPIYEASTQLLVNKKESQSEMLVPNFSDIQSNLKLIETYNVIIKSPRVLEKAIENMGLEMTAGQLSNKIKVNAVQNSQVMSITVSDPDPEKAILIANGIASTFQTEIQTIMNVDNVQILAEAKSQETYSPVKPKPFLNMVIAFVVGLMTAVGIVFLLEYLDNTLKSEQDIERILGLSVLGSIATMDELEEERDRGAAEAKVGGKQLHV